MRTVTPVRQLSCRLTEYNEPTCNGVDSISRLIVQTGHRCGRPQLQGDSEYGLKDMHIMSADVLEDVKGSRFLWISNGMSISCRQ